MATVRITHELQNDHLENGSARPRLMIWQRMRRQHTAFNVPEWLLRKMYRRKAQTIGDAPQQSRIEDQQHGESSEPVDAYREKFKRAPLGRWTSSLEFGPFPIDVWEFYADGTGKILHHAGSGKSVTLFEWQEETERTIKFRETHWMKADTQDEAFSTSEAEPTDWISIVYDFKVIQHYAPIVVMFQVPERDTFKFWWTTDYLQFESDIHV